MSEERYVRVEDIVELDRLRAEIAQAWTENEELRNAVDELRAEVERLQALFNEHYNDANRWAERAAKAETEVERLREALGNTFCPRPANTAPDYLTVTECIERNECGCYYGAVLNGTAEG
jgi:predicted nuclease with TOPRIM domain